jgi:hypothetical protein
MNETTALLHNSGVPALTTLRYEGLGRLAASRPSGVSGATDVNVGPALLGGRVCRVCLPPEFLQATPAEILRLLDIAPSGSGRAKALRQLQSVINRRAAALPLPPGCLVLEADTEHPILWPDPLSALAILTKATDTVWLQTKTPVLGRLSERSTLSVLVPEVFLTEQQGATP